MKETKQAASTPESRAHMHEMLAAFEAFKAMNDERLAAIETKRADPLHDEALARMEIAIQTATAKADRAMAEARRPILTGESKSAGAQTDERKAAFDLYVKTGLESGLEAKGVAEDTAATGGGWLVPPQTEQAITMRIQHTSPMRDICATQTISAAVYRRVFSTVGATTGWAAETAARVETPPPVLANLDIPCSDLYAVPAATQSLLNDALVNIDEWLARECEDAFAFQETQAFINGNGVNQPRGLLSGTIAADANSLPWGTMGYVASGGAGVITSTDPIQDLIYAPRPLFRANGRFIFNKKTTAMLRKLKDTTGDYIWSPPTEAGKPASLFGYPVTEVETMPDPAANSYSIAFGDFQKGYLIVDRAGISVLRDPFTSKPYVLFYTTKRVGGAVQLADAIKLMKFAAA